MKLSYEQLKVLVAGGDAGPAGKLVIKGRHGKTLAHTPQTWHPQTKERPRGAWSRSP